MENRKRKRGNNSSRNPKPSSSSHSSNPNENLNLKRKKTNGGDSSFLDKMKARLSGGYFRMINEKLYTCSGKEALEYFKDDPSLFNVYHTGYQEQMLHWPEQPVNIIIKWLKERNSSLVVADFGCGDARLSKNVKNKVFSIDLVSKDPSVIECDMSNVRRPYIMLSSGNHEGVSTRELSNLVAHSAVASDDIVIEKKAWITAIEEANVTYHKATTGSEETPLTSSSIDVAVFCLSLMGTNFPCFLREAQRVLKPSGWLLIAEVKSRFDPNSGGANPDRFLKAVCELGFISVSKDFSNKMFLLFFFKKKEKKKCSGEKEIKWPELKPCLYKRR